MDLTFTQIPLNLRSPGFYPEFDTNKMRAGLPRFKTRVLICGQKLSGGTATAAVPYRIDGLTQAKTLFGQGSQLAGMIEAWRKNDDWIEIWAIALADNAGGTAATGTLAFTGTATAAGTFDFRVEDQRIQVAVPIGMTATQLGTAAAAAINARADLSCTAASDTGTLTVTARHKGVEGNSIYLSIDYDQGTAIPAGIACTVTAMANGATNPAASGIFTAIGDQPYDAFVHPWTDATNVAVFEVALADRAIATKRNYGWAMTHHYVGYSALATYASTRNSAYHPVVAMQKTPWPSWKMAAATAAQCVASITQDPATPLTALVIKGALPPKVTDRFSVTEREQLLQAGIATLEVDGADRVVLQLMVSTYKANSAGQYDDGLYLLNRLVTLFYIARAQQVLIAETYPRYKLGDDGGRYLPEARVVSPRQIKATLAGQAELFEKAGIIENSDAYVAAMSVKRDTEDRDRVNSFQRPDLINGFLKLASLIQPLA